MDVQDVISMNNNYFLITHIIKKFTSLFFNSLMIFQYIS